MTPATALRPLLVWCLFIPLAIANGLLREFLLSPALGAAIAQPMSGILLSLLIFGLTWWCLPFLGKGQPGRYAAIGLGWLLLTLIFEFGFGRLIAKKPWKDLLAAYDPTTGNLWLLVLAVTAASPWLTARWRKVS